MIKILHIVNVLDYRSMLTYPISFIYSVGKTQNASIFKMCYLKLKKGVGCRANKRVELFRMITEITQSIKFVCLKLFQQVLVKVKTTFLFKEW